MGRERGPLSTRDALVAAAAELIETRGYCAFSYADLARQVGIAKPSIHHHFPGKGDLGVAVVEQLHRDLRQCWTDLERLHPDPGPRLRALFAGARSTAACGGKICPVGSLQSELNALPEPVRSALAASSEDHVATVERWLDEGLNRGQLHFPGTPRAMAQLVVAALQAATQRQRANPAESVDQTVDQLERLVGLDP
jgi:TetR/AcrR family transcriptional repressor of nem operon